MGRLKARLPLVSRSHSLQMSHSEASSAAALYSIRDAHSLQFEASCSQAEYEAQVSRIIEEEATPMVCHAC